MRVSSQPDSPLFWKKLFREDPEILLDGVPIANVLEADDKTGEVIVIKHNGAYPIFAGGRYITETKTGKVTIKGIPT